MKKGVKKSKPTKKRKPYSGAKEHIITDAMEFSGTETRRRIPVASGIDLMFAPKQLEFLKGKKSLKVRLAKDYGANSYLYFKRKHADLCPIGMQCDCASGCHQKEPATVYDYRIQQGRL